MTDIATGVEINCETGNVIEYALTAEDIAQMAKDRAEDAARAEQDAAAKEALNVLKASAKAKLVAGQPLTEEEAAVVII